MKLFTTIPLVPSVEALEEWMTLSAGGLKQGMDNQKIAHNRTSKTVLLVIRGTIPVRTKAATLDRTLRERKNERLLCRSL